MKRYAAAFAFFMCTQLLFVGCARHVIRTHERVSRDTTWIQFAKAETPFVVKGMVGGEHIRRYRLLGFEGERYLIMGTGDDLYMSIDPGNSARLHTTLDEDTFIVEILDLDALISIELSAHPVSEYRLEIEKIWPENGGSQ